MKFEADKMWSTYDSNVQAYRGCFFSSQSLLLAVGAITLDKNEYLTIFLSIIAIFQIWYIWFLLIRARHMIVDYHKYSLYNVFDNEGNEIKNINGSSQLSVDTYIHNKEVRKNVHKNIAKLLGNKKDFKTWRPTRTKIDIISSIFLTLVWIVFAIISIVGFLNKS